MCLKHLPSLQKFIECHNKLVKLSLNVLGFSINVDFAFISRLNYLEEFNIVNGDTEDFRPLYALSQLRKLQKNIFPLRSRPLPFHKFLLNSVAVETLKHLEMRTCKINQPLIDGLSRFRNLHYLSLDFSSTESAPLMYEPLRNLNSITEMRIAGCRDHDGEILSKLMNNLILSNLPLKKLEIVLDFYSDLSIV